MGEIIASTYEIVHKIGSGGGANVYLANHLRLDKLVVLKADKRKITTRPELLRREVDILKGLSQQYIPQVYDYFTENDTVYTVIDYVDGESLDRPLKRGERFSQVQVIAWAKQILSALCYLHSPTHGTPPKGYVHSDIKPANIMVRSNGDICLIDFNIAMALGEENTVGISPGYASPEHYGLDFSSGSYNYTAPDSTRSSIFSRRRDGTRTIGSGTMTGTAGTATGTATGTAGTATGSSAYRYKKVVPDIRSDIYSLGATLYHLLSGVKPEQDALKVVRLSEKEFSPQIVAIIARAMNPNPDLRYQTAEEMLYAFEHLHENDPRTRRIRRQSIVVSACLGAALLIGVGISYVGLRQMEKLQKNYALAESAEDALEEGDAEAALALAGAALPENRGILDTEYSPQAIKALTDALGVYDLSDGYKTYRTVELPSEPTYIELAPDGKTAACIYEKNLAVFDTATGEILATLPAEATPLAEAHYIDSHTIAFSGENGLQVYDISKGMQVWSGSPATQIAVSADGKHIAGIDLDDTHATVYSAADGAVEATVDFAGRHQSASAGDVLYNPENDLLAINADGTAIAVSFSDGSLQIFNLADAAQNWELMEPSVYTKFHGGFFENCFAVSASGTEQSCFLLVNLDEHITSSDVETDGKYNAYVDDSGIYIGYQNYLVRNDPMTGEQTPLVTVAQAIQSYATDSGRTLIATNESYLFYDEYANEMCSIKKDAGVDLLDLSGDYAVIGNVNSKTIRVLKYEDHSAATVLNYDREYEHSEARISADGQSVILYSYRHFRIYSISGEIIAEQDLPDPDEVYAEQVLWYGDTSLFRVLYNDGTVRLYDMATGQDRGTSQEEAPDPSHLEQYETDSYLVQSPLHGSPEVYDKATGEKVTELSENAMLARVEQAGDSIVVQYVTAAGEVYGKLYDAGWNEIAELPDLCDVDGTTLYFDCASGAIRKTEIYSLEELLDLNH